MATSKKVARKPRLKKLVIKESRWVRFGSPVASMLYIKKRPQDRTGMMCCLGFLAQACGARASQIKDKVAPMNAPRVKWPKGVLTRHPETAELDSEWTLKAMTINDDLSLREHGLEATLEERKAILTKHFVKIGFKLVFVP
jgi:hypothetical protein